MSFSYASGILVAVDARTAIIKPSTRLLSYGWLLAKTQNVLRAR
jgi:hypothetical protein